MDLVRIASRVASDDPPVMSTWFEGGSYVPEDIVGGLPAPDAGPVWASLYGFGWVVSFQDPATLTPETPVDGSGIVETWGEMLEHEDFAEGAKNLRQYPNAAAFAADDNTLRFMCSYDEAEREGMAAELEAGGYADAAARCLTVSF